MLFFELPTYFKRGGNCIFSTFTASAGRNSLPGIGLIALDLGERNDTALNVIPQRAMDSFHIHMFYFLLTNKLIRSNTISSGRDGVAAGVIQKSGGGQDRDVSWDH